jgi:cation transport ATPase
VPGGASDLAPDGDGRGLRRGRPAGHHGQADDHAGGGGAALLQAAADGEQHSNHPLARSILDTAEQARIRPNPVDGFEEIRGRGVISKGGDGDIHAGRADWLLELNAAIREQVDAVEQKIEGMSGVHVMAAPQRPGGHPEDAPPRGAAGEHLYG